MNNQYDIVVIGSGHNALITAGYLAKAGEKVLVLERHDSFGGGVSTGEIVAPGFKHDIHSSCHVYIQANPLILNDELQLQSKFGLKYIYPEAVFSTIFEDQSFIVTYSDLDKTCESIARISPQDAEAYRRFVAMSKQVLPLIVSGLFVPPAPQGPFWALLDQTPEGQELMRAMQSSVYDIITKWFVHEKVIIHLLKFVSEALVNPEERGTGITMYTMPGFVHTYPAGMPEGGSGALADSLVRCLEAYGAELRPSTEIAKVLVDNGRATGVQTTEGETIYAKTAVLGTIHPWLLDNYVDGLDTRLIENAKRVEPSSYSPAAAHFALHEVPEYNAGEEPGKAFLVGLTSDNLEEFRRVFDSFRYGEIPSHLMQTALVNSQIDPTRAPAGKATLCLWGFMPFELKNGGSARWDELNEEVGNRMLENYRHYVSNLDDENIIGRRYDMPLDMKRFSPSFQHGDVHGCGPFLNQFGGHRPTPELASYNVPGIDSFYLTGCFMHPGGGVFGGGRATAIKVCTDLDIDFDTLIN